MTRRSFQIHWQGIPVTITIEDDYSPAYRRHYGHGMAHLEISAGQPLPISETGYRSLFLPTHTLADEGGPVAFVTTWLDYAAELEGWHGAQLSLF